MASRLVARDVYKRQQYGVPGGAGGVQVNDALVAGAAEPQRNIVLCGDEFAVHQHIDQAQHLSLIHISRATTT